MPSKKGMEQCVNWLQSKMAEKDTLDGINAEVCYNIIMEQKEKLNRLGMMFNQVKSQRDKFYDTLYNNQNDGGLPFGLAGRSALAEPRTEYDEEGW